ncbi:MAG: hypothetical protein Q8K32_32320 [Archangium sp.]|nr:hypothetical protein [Archangium sp.]
MGKVEEEVVVMRRMVRGLVPARSGAVVVSESLPHAAEVPAGVEPASGNQVERTLGLGEIRRACIGDQGDEVLAILGTMQLVSGKDLHREEMRNRRDREEETSDDLRAFCSSDDLVFDSI